MFNQGSIVKHAHGIGKVVNTYYVVDPFSRKPVSKIEVLDSATKRLYNYFEYDLINYSRG